MKNGFLISALIFVLAAMARVDASEVNADKVVTDKMEVLQIEPDAAAPGSVRMADGMSLGGAFAVAGGSLFFDGVSYILPLGDVPMGDFTNMPDTCVTPSNAPSWWQVRGVTETNAPCDFAAATQGQVKWIAAQAAAEFKIRLGSVGGMGASVSNLVASFSLTNNSLPVALGQLKNVAKPFYDRLAQVCIATNYPWSGQANDYALANVGQVKFLFSFDFDRDADGDGMPDGWEVSYGLDPRDPSDGIGDMDGDGLLNVHEYGMGTNPSLMDSDGDGMEDLMEFQNGFAPTVFDVKFPDSDDDGLNDLDELAWGADPNDADTDNDGLTDYKEICENFYHGHAHTNVTVYGVYVCGTDPVNPDSDGDGLNDGDELKYGTDPWLADTEGDGIDDFKEINTQYLFAWRTDETTDYISPVTNAVSLINKPGNNDFYCLLQNGCAVKINNGYPNPFTNCPLSCATNIVKLDCGGDYGTAVLSSGKTVTWNNASLAFVDERTFGSKAKDVACGTGHYLVLLEDGTVRTFGYVNPQNGITNQPPGITSVVAIAAGEYHSLALLSNGCVVAWGDNTYGQTNVPKLATNTISISAGNSHCAALQRDGRVFVWGYGSFGLTNNNVYVTNAVEVACGNYHCIARLKDSTNVFAWGMLYGGASRMTNYTFSSSVRAVRAGHSDASVVILENGLATLVGYGLRQPKYLRVVDCVSSGNGVCAIAGTDPLKSDSDADGLPDGWELRFGFNPLSPIDTNRSSSVYWDPDGDGLSNLQEYLYGTNPKSADGDGDGLNDAEEHAAVTDAFNPDTDGDGLNDGDEVKRFGSSPLLRDTDSDGLSDYDGVRRYGTSPFRSDSDNDGLADAEEVLIYGTNPNSADTDRDGLPDKWEVDHNSDPLNPDGSTTVDSDSDGLPDYWEMRFFGGLGNYLGSDDADGDGMSNSNEYLAMTDPTNEFSFVSGLPASWKTCDLGIPERIGGASATNSVITLVGGYSSDSSSDRYRICYQPVWGDFTFTAHIAFVGDGGAGGIFVRKSDDPDTVKLELFAKSDGTDGYRTRLATATACEYRNCLSLTSVWCRIERKGVMLGANAGGTFVLSCSTNGETPWTVLKATTNYCDMGVETIVGLYARSEQSGGLASIKFSDISLSSADYKGYCPFSLLSADGCLFGGTNAVTVQPLVTGLTFTVAATTNASFSSLYSGSVTVTNLSSLLITNTAPAFVRVKASRPDLSDTYRSLFVSNRHLNGWNACYYPLTENDWPAFTNTNLAWVCHIPSEDFDPDGNIAAGFWGDHVAVRLQTILDVPCTVVADSNATYVFKVEWTGAARVSLKDPYGSDTWPLPEKEDSAVWQTSIITNSYVRSGLNIMTVDLKAWSGSAGVRLWWRPLYDPVFRRILPTDCFVEDYNTNGYSDAAEKWLGPNWGLGLYSDTDGDGISDLDEALRYHTDPFDPGSHPLLPAAGVQIGDTIPGLVACGFRDSGGVCANLYDQSYPYAVTPSYVGAVSFHSDVDLSMLLPSNAVPSGLTFDGYFFAETNDWFEFSVLADDRAVFELDGVRLVTVVTPGLRTGGAYLMAGLHALRLAYENRVGGKQLELSYHRMGGQSGLVPSRLLRHREADGTWALARLDSDSDGTPDSIDGHPFVPDVGTDSDGDGVSDEEERTLSLTDPFRVDITTNFVWQCMVSGGNGRSVSGEWFIDGGGLYCASRSGTAGFNFSTVSNGFYCVDLYAREFAAFGSGQPFRVELFVDGVTCGVRTFTPPAGVSGCVRFYTPFLMPGQHALAVRWINTLERHTLMIERLAVMLLGGSDTDGDGMADWAVTRMTNLLCVAAPPQSHTSPVCLEGRDAGCMDSTILGGFPVRPDDPAWMPVKRRLPGNAWYADVPLSTNGITRVTAGFDGVPVVSTCAVEWVAMNVAACREIDVRRNDTLKFWIAAMGTNAATASLGTNVVLFTIGTNTVSLGTNVVAVTATNTPVFFTFPECGNYVIRAAWSNGLQRYSLETRVRVVGAAFSRDPLLIVGQETAWVNPSLFSNVWVEADGHLLLSWGSDGTLNTTLTEDRTAYVAARLYEEGPVLATAKADAFVFSTHDESGYMQYLYTLADGTRAFQGRISLANLTSDFSVTLSLLSNNYFVNGLQSITYTAADFDENGELVFIMYVTGNAFCHGFVFKQGDALIKVY